MAKRKIKRLVRRLAHRLKKSRRKTGRISRVRYRRIIKSSFVIKRPRRITDKRLERGLRILSETNDVSAAARAIRVSPENFKRAAKRKRAIRKRNGRWKIAGRLPRRVPIFSNGRQLAITVRIKTASLIGRYNSAVRKFLRTNKPEVLAEFAGRSVKDTRGKLYRFETDANELYRLSSAGGEPFHEIYRIVL